MRKMYETPVAEVVSFAALERIAVNERARDDETNLDNGSVVPTPGGDVGGRGDY